MYFFHSLYLEMFVWTFCLAWMGFWGRVWWDRTQMKRLAVQSVQSGLARPSDVVHGMVMDERRGVGVKRLDRQTPNLPI